VVRGGLIAPWPKRTSHRIRKARAHGADVALYPPSSSVSPRSRMPIHLWRPLPILGAIMLLAACRGFAQSGAPDAPLTGPSFDFAFSPALEACVTASGFSGSVLVADLARGVGWFGPDTLMDTPLLPASTFKIVSTLMALDAGLVDGGETMLPWDGVLRAREETNQSLDLASAFRISAVPHYQALVRALGEARVAAYLETLGYGNQDASGGADTFWLTGGLRITPREQIHFLARLAAGTLPLPADIMAETREVMLVEQAPEWALRAKTGLTTAPEGETVGWWVGWVEREDATAGGAGDGARGEAMARAATYLFATALTSTPPAPAGFAEARLDVTRCALRALEVLP
jgi:beta-lactamase class D